MERAAYPVLASTVEKALAQLAQERVWVFCAQPRGEEMTAEERASPFPERSPPKVVEAVPPTATEMVDEAARAVPAELETITLFPVNDDAPVPP